MAAHVGRIGSIDRLPDEHNFVYRVTGSRGAAVLKHAPPYLAEYPDWPLTQTRGLHEALAYETWYPVAGDRVPRVIDIDREQYVFAIADVAVTSTWRDALCEGRIVPEAAAVAGGLVAAIAGAPPPAPAGLDLANPELTGLMSGLVFDEPYAPHPNDSFAPELAPLVREFRADRSVQEARRALARISAESREALIHGDLHTGAFALSPTGATVIVAEFSRMGPVAWDIGALWGNLLIAAARAVALGDAPRAHDVLGLALTVKRSFDERSEAGVQWRAKVERDGVGFAGCEAARRVIGIGRIDDLDTLGPEQRLAASEVALRTARSWIAGYGAGLEEAIARFPDG